ncbi:MAG TPA: hypothetical protein PKN96_09000 [Flavobacterium sp.]|uniref:hypothetical protein n=1 Tax=Flavobacterium sp. TaxID=239 RepID=UPI002BC6B06C|nr:hypothetical protein [Flavobacterium sp.]HNP33418.1 hypothetical protein [Flavobacterium sp.]
MKREYFGMLFILGCAVFVLLAFETFGEEKVQNILSRFIVIWILIGFYVGQYSMRFPKRF